MKFFRSLIVFLFVYTTLTAHPVTWKDGKVFQVDSSDYATVLQSHYSVSVRNAFGITHLYQKKTDSSYTFLHTNWLIKRWNTSFSQANIYALTGLGLRMKNNSLPSYLAIQTDWETKNTYVFFKLEQHFLNSPHTLLRFRYGVAPYEGAFNDWHTWVFLQVDDTVYKTEHCFQVLPVLRFFRNQVLFEFGFNFDKTGFASLMFHF